MASTAGAVWHLVDEFGQKQPTSIRELQTLFDSGGVGHTSKVWKAGMAEPMPLGLVAELQGLVVPLNAAAASEPASEWFYLNDEGQQQGPYNVDEMALGAMEKSLIADTLVWKEGMSEWLALSKIDDLKAVLKLAQAAGAGSGDKKKQPPKGKASAASAAGVAAANSAPAVAAPTDPADAWLYFDNYRVQQGPVTKAALRILYEQAAIAKQTLVWKAGFAEWRKLEEVEELSAVHAPISEKSAVAGTPAANGGAAAGGAAAGAMDVDAPAGTDDGAARAPVPMSAEEEAKRKRAEKRKRQKEKKKHQWKAVEHHANVYVTGLPTDVTIDELHEHMKRGGVIKQHDDGPWRIKIYRSDDGQVKGDALVSYLREESIEQAVLLLDGAELRPGKPNTKLSVQKAKFEMKGTAYVAKPVVKKTKVDKLAAKTEQDKALAWDLELLDEDKSAPRIVILKPMFHPDEAKDEASFYDDLKLEVGAECENQGGPVEKVTVFENNPDGVVAVKFRAPASAAKCIEKLHGRFFGGRQLECFYWDNKTNYKVKESEEQTQARLKEFGDWLETGKE